MIRAGERGGSGTVFHLDLERGLAFVTTNSHVVPQNVPVNVIFSKSAAYPEGRTAKGRFLATDRDADITLIAISAEAKTPYVPMAERSPEPGTQIWQVGYPYFTNWTRPIQRTGRAAGFAGSGRNMRLSDNVYQEVATSLRLQLRINSGDSGSGVFNSAGELCGMCWGSSNSDSLAVAVENIWAIVERTQYVGLCQPKRPGQRPPPPGPPPPIEGPIGQAPRPPPVEPQPPIRSPGVESVEAIRSEIAEIKRLLDKIDKTPGKPGRDGSPGPQGPSGSPGPQGPKGDQGKAADEAAIQAQIALLLARIERLEKVPTITAPAAPAPIRVRVEQKPKVSP